MKLTERYAEFVKRRAWYIILVVALMTAGAAQLASRLTISTDLSALLPRGYPSVEDLHRLMKRIGGSASLTIAIESPELKANERFADALVPRLRSELADEIANIDYKIDAVKQFYERHAAVYLSLEDLEGMESDLDQAIARAKLRAAPIEYDLGLDDEPGAANKTEPDPQDKLDDIEKRMDEAEKPFAAYPDGFYAGENGKLLAIFVRPRTSGADPDAARAFIAKIEKIVASLEPAKFHPQLKVGYTGAYRISLEEQAAIAHDLVSTALLCIGLIALAVLVYFRRMRVLWILSVTLVCGCAWAFALARLTVGYLNIQTAFLGSIIAGTGINYGIILLARYLEERRRGVGEAQALAVAIDSTLVATLTAATTTAISFGTLLIARISSFKHFAVIGGGGILFCWILSYTLLPALLVLSERMWPTTRRQQVDTLWPKSLSWLPVTHARVIAWGAAVTTLLGIGAFAHFVPHILETDGRNLRNQSSVTSGSAKLDDRVSRLRSESSTPGFVVTDSLEESNRVCEVLNARVKQVGVAQAPLSKCRSIFSLLPEQQTEKIEIGTRLLHKLGKLPKEALTEKTRQRLDQLQRKMVLDRISLDNLPEEMLRPFREVTGEVGRLVAVYPPEGRDLWIAQNLYAFTDNIRRIDLPDGRVITSSGEAVIFADILREIAHDAPRTTALALAGVITFVFLALRRGRATLHVVASLVIGVVWMVGLQSLMRVKLNFFNFVAIPTTFGIAVDYAINVYGRYRSIIEGAPKAEGHSVVRSPADAMFQALRSTGGAVFLCSLTTIIGYATLVIADNLALVSFGKLAILGEVCCVGASLLVLPATILLDRREHHR